MIQIYNSPQSGTVECHRTGRKFIVTLVREEGQMGPLWLYPNFSISQIKGDTEIVGPVLGENNRIVLVIKANGVLQELTYRYTGRASNILWALADLNSIENRRSERESILNLVHPESLTPEKLENIWTMFLKQHSDEMDWRYTVEVRGYSFWKTVIQPFLQKETTWEVRKKFRMYVVMVSSHPAFPYTRPGVSLLSSSYFQRIYTLFFLAREPLCVESIHTHIDFSRLFYTHLIQVYSNILRNPSTDSG